MKICFLGDAGSIHVKRWCMYFRDCGDEVHLISFREGTVDGVTAYNVGEGMGVRSQGGNIQYLKEMIHIKKLLNQIKPDIVNAHYLTSYGLIGALTKKAPLVVSTWGSDILVTPWQNIVYKKLTQYVIKRADLLSSDSGFMSEKICELGCNHGKVITVPMGIEPDIFNQLERGNTADNITIASMRTLCDNSNIDIIINAFAVLANEIKGAKLIIANSGDRENYLKDLAAGLGLGDRITFLGSISRDEVVSLLKKSRVYVSIPASDSTSVTLLEAMACGTFPILSDLPANREWVEDGQNGYIIKQNNAEILYAAMKKALTDDRRILSASEMNSKIIADRAIWNKNMGYIRKNYLKLLNN
jgi:glycosyltransferase involved in cell wall biosynthesis